VDIRRAVASSLNNKELTELHHVPALLRQVERVTRVLKPKPLNQVQLLVLEAIVEPPQILVWETLAVVDAAIILDETFFRDFLLDTGVVQICVEHDQGERENVRCV